MPAFVDSAFTVRQPAWWDLDGSHNKDEYPESIDQALEWSGLDWEPVGTPVFHTKESLKCVSKEGCSSYAVSMVNGQYPSCGTHSQKAAKKGHTVTPLPLKQLGDYYAVMRSDNGSVLSVANSSYELFGNRETAEFVEMMLDSKVPEVKLETGGALEGGKKVWFLARLDEPLEIKGDASPIYPYVSVLNSHDGTAALRAINTSIRIVCWNTWSAAERQSEKSGRVFSFRHTGTIRERIEEARNVVLGAKHETEEWVRYAEKMIAIPIREDQLETFLTEFVPMPPDGAISDRVRDNVLQSRQSIRNFYHGPSCASIAGTAWGLIQATGEFLDHGREYRTKETYVSRTMLKPEKGKHKALKLVEELVSA